MNADCVVTPLLMYENASTTQPVLWDKWAAMFHSTSIDEMYNHGIKTVKRTVSLNAITLYFIRQWGGERTLIKVLARGILVIAFLFCAWYGYAFLNSRNVLVCVSNSYLVNGPRTAINTTHQYYFRLVNRSHKTIKILNIYLEPSSGVEVNDVTVDGSSMPPKLISANRQFTVDYNATFHTYPPQTPLGAKIIYSYRGIRHTEAVIFPFPEKNGH